MGYKMNGFSGFGNSPMKKKTPHGKLKKEFDIDKHLDKKEIEADVPGWQLMLNEEKAKVEARDAKMDRLMYRHKRGLLKPSQRHDIISSKRRADLDKAQRIMDEKKNNTSVEFDD